jgi:glycosyltransferase involved in cell wall biosynthesis
MDVTSNASFGTLSLHGRTILQIIPRLDAGGAERTTVDMAEAIVKAGGRALVATEGGRLTAELEAKGGVHVPLPMASKNPVTMGLNIGRLMNLCAEEHVDLLHARSRAPAWSALAVSRWLDLPFVTTYHGSYSGHSALKRFYNSVMARSDAVIANSHYTARTIEAANPFAGGKIHTIYRGTDFNLFSPETVSGDRMDALKHAWQIPTGGRIILMAARFTRLKGHLGMLNAFKAIMDQGISDSFLVFAGDTRGRDHYVDEIRAMIARLGLEGRVKIVPHITDMAAACNAAALVVMPSTEPETFGRTAVEAQALETPVIVSQIGAFPETVVGDDPDKRTGWLVPPGDSEALAAALREALSMPQDARAALGQRARAHVVSHFSLEAMTTATLDVYQQLLAKKAR